MCEVAGFTGKQAAEALLGLMEEKREPFFKRASVFASVCEVVLDGEDLDDHYEVVTWGQQLDALVPLDDFAVFQRTSMDHLHQILVSFLVSIPKAFIALMENFLEEDKAPPALDEFLRLSMALTGLKRFVLGEGWDAALLSGTQDQADSHFGRSLHLALKKVLEEAARYSAKMQGKHCMACGTEFNASYSWIKDS